MAKFTMMQWKSVWDSLTKEQQQEIRAKARWEGVSLSAVMREWWPELWRQVGAKGDE